MNKNAKWLKTPENNENKVFDFKKKFELQKSITKAKLCVSAMGVYAAYINGARVGEYVLSPGWTSYKHRVQYQTYDVTDMLSLKNEIVIGVAPGWANSMGKMNGKSHYCEYSSIIASLELTYSDGTSRSLVTNTDWEIWTSHVIQSTIYHGETVDNTAEISFVGKAELSDVKAKLIPQEGEQITEHEVIVPVELILTPKGERVIDFGQNMTGYVELYAKGERGGRIVIHHAEVLDKDGNFYNDNYRSAKDGNVYVLSGNEDTFKPLYTFQGFRYIRLTEYPFDSVDLSDFRAIAVHSDIKRTGYFRCGNEKINQLYHNIIWGQKSNYLDVPTDCPQRDERLGWTGDTQVFCRTAAINYDVEKFLAKWLEDLALEQRTNGAVGAIVPDCYSTDGDDAGFLISAAWGDAACIVPWELYMAYGNKELLRKHFPMMKKWVDYQRSAGDEEFLWLTGAHYGDWLAMDNGPDKDKGATANDLIASAFFANSCSIVINAGKALGENVDCYRELHQNIVSKFREYFMEDGMPKEEFPLTEKTPKPYTMPMDDTRKGVTQTAIALILRFGLCLEEERIPLAKKLVSLIKDFDNRMSTGFVGTPHILHALSENGYTDIAYMLLMQEKNPSWLYSVCHGATTMWEHWNGIKEDGSFWSAGMNSFNHYAYGAVYDWIFGVSAGITPLAPGYGEVGLQPHPHRCMGSFLEASIESRMGKITSHWYYKGERVYYEFDIPRGVTAHIKLPNGYEKTLTCGKYHFAG